MILYRGPDVAQAGLVILLGAQQIISRTLGGQRPGPQL